MNGNQLKQRLRMEGQFGLRVTTKGMNPMGSIMHGLTGMVHVGSTLDQMNAGEC